MAGSVVKHPPTPILDKNCGCSARTRWPMLVLWERNPSANYSL